MGSLRVALIGFLAAGLPACGASEDVSVKQIVDAAMAAHGDAAYAALGTSIRSCTMKFSTGETLSVNELQVFPNKWLRHDIVQADGTRITKVLAGSSGFVSDGRAVSDLAAADVQALSGRRHENDALDVFELRLHESELRALGAGEIAGQAVLTLERTVASAQGTLRLRYSFRRDSGLLAKKEKLVTGGDDATLSEQYFDDYRTEHGLKIPFKVTTYLNGNLYVTETLSEIHLGEPIDSEYFERPK